jgi:hypothetical protein
MIVSKELAPNLDEAYRHTLMAKTSKFKVELGNIHWLFKRKQPGYPEHEPRTSLRFDVETSMTAQKIVNVWIDWVEICEKLNYKHRNNLLKLMLVKQYEYNIKLLIKVTENEQLTALYLKARMLE